MNEAGIPHDGSGQKCPLCGKLDADEGHLFCACPKVCQNPDVIIQKTNRYCDEHRRTSLSMKCYWWRGLQPRVQTTPLHPARACYQMLGAPIDQYDQSTITVFTDGPGGKYSSDKRQRRCAWAWVCPQAGSNQEVLPGARGSLGGKQMLQREELTAILECLNDLKQNTKIKEIVIYTDCKISVDMQRGKHMLSSQPARPYGLGLGRLLLKTAQHSEQRCWACSKMK